MYLAKKYPSTTIRAVDINPHAVRKLQDLAKKEGLRNLIAEAHDGCNMPVDWSNKFDYIFVCDVVHDAPFSSKLISEAYRMLKPGCNMSVFEVNVHANIHDNLNLDIGPYIYATSLYRCMPLSLNTPGSEGLGAAWGREKIINMFLNAGFKTCDVVGEAGLEFHSVLTK